MKACIPPTLRTSGSWPSLLVLGSWCAKRTRLTFDPCPRVLGMWLAFTAGVPFWRLWPLLPRHRWHAVSVSVATAPPVTAGVPFWRLWPLLPRHRWHAVLASVATAPRSATAHLLPAPHCRHKVPADPSDPLNDPLNDPFRPTDDLLDVQPTEALTGAGSGYEPESPRSRPAPCGDAGALPQQRLLEQRGAGLLEQRGAGLLEQRGAGRRVGCGEGRGAREILPPLISKAKGDEGGGGGGGSERVRATEEGWVPQDGSVQAYQRR